LQKTFPDKEDLASSKVFYPIFPPEVEISLGIKFPFEESRAQEAGYVSVLVVIGKYIIF
jgi:hypothetical protein